ncbi:MAG: 5'/3'-nucleotidase SurE [Vicinamibacterales bacterium]|jgi:5'-nucleotidase|nr:5'/3'-nucleotidase SurE [Vicinamibacterales bacterium]MDP6609744.1 5'/3'-nucleotidase SurE [Vicinamibacterales bacterium]|tara:strand:+ start:13548 stop:14363 length:816 start_codon:yes stop_codon:yes gene_type:complete
MRILLTNDDGIEEVEARLLPVAGRLREIAEVYIVVSNQDRSGTSNMLAISRSVSLESRLEYRSEAGSGQHLLEVHSVDGYPTDCVVLGVYGLLKGRNVDLVVSGPNGGANLADGWFGSGTIGAARAAAFIGLPAVAISGFDSSEPAQVAALAEWVSALARSDAVRTMPPLTYLTVAVPRTPPGEIRGVRVASRARLLSGFDVNRVAEMDTDDGPTAIWSLRPVTRQELASPEEDFSLYAENWIVVTPMTVDEHVDRAPGPIDELLTRLPPW